MNIDNRQFSIVNCQSILAERIDYYKILGLNEWADEAEIKSAYRKLALKYHPDRNPGDTFAEDKFKKVTEAYRVLSDSGKRLDYDRVRDSSKESARASTSQKRRVHVDDVFNMFESFSGSRSSSRAKKKKTRGADLHATLSLSFEEAMLGTTAFVDVTRQEPCSRCKGTGIEPRVYPMLCSTCHGKGRIRQSHGFLGFMQVCHECDGTGRVYQKPCAQCRGDSRMSQQRKIAVNIPPGVSDGASIKKTGEGDSGVQGGASGDLHVQLQVRPHESLNRKNHDIWYDLPLSMTQATLGDIAEVPTLEGKVRIRIPPGTQPEQVFRVSNRGIPDVNNGTRGDLLVKAKLYVPTGISSRQRQLLEEFARLSGETRSGGLARIWKGSTFAATAWLKKIREHMKRGT